MEQSESVFIASVWIFKFVMALLALGASRAGVSWLSNKEKEGIHTRDPLFFCTYIMFIWGVFYLIVK